MVMALLICVSQQDIIFLSLGQRVNQCGSNSSVKMVLLLQKYSFLHYLKDLYIHLHDFEFIDRNNDTGDN